MATETVMTYLDSYCERAGNAAVFAEPWNAFTNLFFIIAALLAAKALYATRVPGKCMDLWILIFFLFLIGVGSGLWHLLPNKHTVLMDVIPITLFINFYILSALRHLFMLSWNKVVLWWALYFVAGVAAQFILPPDTLNGTIMYIPTYLTLVVITWALRKRDRESGAAFTCALAVWTLSLTLRTVDHAICPTFAIGTHFMWHTLNAWVLWRLLKVLIDDLGKIVRS